MANQIKKDIIKDAYASKEVKYYRDLAKKAADSKKGIEEITKNLSNLSGKELENAIKQIEQYEEVLSSARGVFGVIEEIILWRFWNLMIIC